jgi:hypothetical protein
VHDGGGNFLCLLYSLIVSSGGRSRDARLLSLYGGGENCTLSSLTGPTIQFIPSNDSWVYQWRIIRMVGIGWYYGIYLFRTRWIWVPKGQGKERDSEKPDSFHSLISKLIFVHSINKYLRIYIYTYLF